MTSSTIHGLRSVAAAILLIGCTERGAASEGSVGSEGTGTASAGTTESETPTTGEPLPDTNGFVCVAMGVGEGLDTDPYEGTRTVQITLRYDPCLDEYYRNVHPERRLDGPQGMDLFALWKSRLCSEPVDALVKCEVVGFEQAIPFDGEPATMTITYAIPADGDLLGRKLLWGPGPLPAAAECMSGDLPSATVVRTTDVIGADEDGKQIWRLQSFGNKTGVMATDGEGCVQVFAEYVD